MAKAVLRKDWYEITAPELFGGETISETPAEEQEMVQGRTVKVGLKDLMPSSDKYFMDVFLQVEEVEGDTARTQLVGHTTSREYISKMVSRGSNRIDTVVDVQTADGRTVRVKTIGVTIRKTNSAKVTHVRDRIEETIRTFAEDRSYDDLMESIFADEVQREVRDACQDIYPLRSFEIRRTELR